MMLRVFFICFICYAPYLVVGQYQLDSVVVYKDSLKIVTIQQFDPEYLQLEVRKEQHQSGKSVTGLEKIWVQYDALNNEVLRVISEWDGNLQIWVEKQKHEGYYDSENRMTMYAEYQMQNGKWEGAILTNREYFGQTCVHTTDYRWKDGQWQPSSNIKAQFDAANNETLRLTFEWDSLTHNWHPREKHVHSYHRENTLSESSSYVWNADKWQNKEKIVYEYNMSDSTSLTDQLVYTGTSDGWVETQRTIISYYDSARRQEIYTWSEEEKGWLRETLSESYFDRHGRETDFLYKSAKYGVHFQRLTIFDKEGRITLAQEIGYDGNKHAFGSQTSYVFDEYGNTLSEQDKFLDVENGRWIKHEERNYIFDQSISLRANNGVWDKGNLGLVNIPSNEHAVCKVHIYNFQNDRRVLKDTTKFYYSIRE